MADFTDCFDDFLADFTTFGELAMVDLCCISKFSCDDNFINHYLDLFVANSLIFLTSSKNNLTIIFRYVKLFLVLINIARWSNG